MNTFQVGYRDEQLALRWKAEAAEKRAAEADRRRRAAEVEVDRLRQELTWARAAPPDLGLAAAKRAFLVFLGGLAVFAVLVSSSIAMRAIPPRTSAPPSAVTAPMVPLATAPAPAWDFRLIEGANLEMQPDPRCSFVFPREELVEMGQAGLATPSQ